MERPMPRRHRFCSTPTGVLAVLPPAVALLAAGIGLGFAAFAHTQGAPGALSLLAVAGGASVMAATSAVLMQRRAVLRLAAAVAERERLRHTLDRVVPPDLR
jgi:hypothetical protein